MDAGYTAEETMEENFNLACSTSSFTNKDIGTSYCKAFYFIPF